MFNGIFRLIGATYEDDGRRNVCVFELELIETASHIESEEERGDVSPGRLIPTDVKLDVWKRDQGCCQFEGCGSKTDLHFDHIIPFSKGGSSREVKNIQLLCARHNIVKRDRIN